MKEEFGATQEELNRAISKALVDWQDTQIGQPRGPCIGSTFEELVGIFRLAVRAVGFECEPDEVEAMILRAIVDGRFKQCSKHRGYYLTPGWRKGAAGAREWENKRIAHDRKN